MNYQTMNYQTLRLRQQPGVQFIQLDRPAAQNALNESLVRELTELYCALEDDPQINVIVLEGQPTVFCSGMDFQEYVETERDPAVWTSQTFTLFRRFTESAKIIVARVQGKVTAGGMGLVAASDLVIAERGASFALSEALFGLLPAMVLPFLIRRIGQQRARLLALSTQPIDVVEAHRWGLVDSYGDDTDQLLQPYLQRWRRLSPQTIRRLKTYMNALQPIDLATQNLAIQTIAEVMADPEVKQGIRRYVGEGVAPWTR